MSNDYFSFKQFTIFHDRSAFKVGTDGVLLGAAADVSSAGRILDIGTGTGLIAIMLAQRCQADITAIETDDESYSQAVENVQKCKWKNRIRVEKCDLQTFLSESRFDLIVSNPPYFVDSLRNPDKAKSIARHNVSLSQDDLLQAAVRLLEEDGKLQLILPYVEGNVFIAVAGEYGLFCNSIIKVKPLPSSGINRLILGFSRKRTPVTEKFLTIEKGKRHEYTDDYIELTRDFYLKF